jgi:predicted transcriptional regulator
MKAIKVGIATQQAMRERVLAIAKGELKPQPDDPKVWFTSMRSFAKALDGERLRPLVQADRYEITAF